MSDSIKIATTINYLAKDLQRLRGITFLLNNNWSISDSNSANPTLPVCFFDVLDMKEICDSEISTKKLIMFNDSNNKTDMPVIETIADNIKPNPKKYSLEILVPYGTNLVTAFSVMQSKATFLAGYTSTFLSEKTYLDDITADANYGAITSSVFGSAITSIISNLYENWGNFSLSDIQQVMRTPNYNKLSLESMWKNRSILKMKSWEDWEYKNVSILNYSISKKGIEDDYYRATLVVQEMPILTVVPDSTSLFKKTAKSDLTSTFIGEKLKTVFEALDTGD